MEQKTLATTDLFDKCYQQKFLDLTEQDYHYFFEPEFSELNQPGCYVNFNGKKVLSWSINDYLGLRNDPRIQQAALAGVQQHGLATPLGSRMLTGNTPQHMQLEAELAQHFNKEAAFVSVIGYLGIASAITSLVGPGDTVILDRLSHSCIIDAATIAQHRSGQRMRFFRHNDMNDLEHQLQQVRKKNTGGILIVTEGVFGMHSTLGNLKEICALKQKYQARLIVDDAHGTGVMGKHGLGTGEHFAVHDDIDIYFKTFSKTFCSMGSLLLGDKDIIRHIRIHGRQTMMTRGLPIAFTYHIRETLNVLRNEVGPRQEKLWSNARQLQEGLLAQGFDIGAPQSPITPIKVSGNITKLKKILTLLREEYQIYLSGYAYPVVPPDTLLLKVVPTAAHTSAEIQHTLNALSEMSHIFIE